MTTGRMLPTLYAVSIGMSALIVTPLLRPGYLLYRDAVSTPRSYVTDTTVGVGELPPRAVPQDWFVAITSATVDGGLVVAAVIVAALVFAGVGYGRLAARLVPGAGRTGAAGAAIVAIWNPYVAERLLQGHWGLLVGYATLGWIVVAAMDLCAEPRPRRWLQLGGLLAAAGVTPSGSLLAAAVLTVAVAALRPRPAVAAGAAGLWIVGALPWLTATLVGSASVATGPGGLDAFGVRSEPLLGPAGTIVGLGGIWNADAVPASRTIWWAAVATGCLLLVICVGGRYLWQRRRDLEPVAGALVALAVAVAVGLTLSVAGPGHAALAAVVDHAPGGGLLRDSQKFVALLMPAVALSVAAAVTALRRRVPGGFALGAVALLIVAPLPDLAWGVGGQVRTVGYPADWSTAAQLVSPEDGALAVWPPGTVRRYGFTDGPSLDPASRFFRAPVVESGRLVVDGVTVDPATPRGAAVAEALGGTDPEAVARLGVGWVLVENGEPPAALADTAPVFTGDSLRLYRIDGAVDRTAPAGTRLIAEGAHWVWLATLLTGAVAATPLPARRSPRTS